MIAGSPATMDSPFKALFEWNDVLFEYVGFLASFGILGALGFRYGVLRADGAAVAPQPDSPLARVFQRMSAGAAGVGLVGVGLGGISFAQSLLERAEQKHLPLADALLSGGPSSIAQAVFLPTLLLAFGLAWRRVPAGWPLAGGAGLALALRGLLTGRLWGMVNPLHVLAASLWLGTLFVLVVCGLGQMLRSAAPVVDRERAVAAMVNRFSTVALASGALLGATGVLTSWKHLKPLAALWSTPYGYALLAKLAVVSVVAGMGAWNWRRVGPSLGQEGGTLRIRRAAATELAFAAVVLFLTAILVSLPSPKLPAH
jgi:putative copper export protein